MVELPQAAPALRILVVDDEDLTREALARYLALRGFEVVAAAEFEEGAALLDRRRFDVAILDLSLSGRGRLDGVELVEQARYRWPNLAIVVYSGHAEEGLREECLRRGAHAFVAKPTPLPELTEAMLAVVRRDRA